MSSALVTDQKPCSVGNSVSFEVQCTGHSWRRRLNTSRGGPSSHSSRSVTRISLTSVWSGSLRVDVMLPSGRRLLASRPRCYWLAGQLERISQIGTCHRWYLYGWQRHTPGLAVPVRAAGRNLGLELSVHQGPGPALAGPVGGVRPRRSGCADAGGHRGADPATPFPRPAAVGPLRGRGRPVQRRAIHPVRLRREAHLV